MWPPRSAAATIVPRTKLRSTAGSEAASIGGDATTTAASAAAGGAGLRFAEPLQATLATHAMHTAHASKHRKGRLTGVT